MTQLITSILLFGFIVVVSIIGFLSLSDTIDAAGISEKKTDGREVSVEKITTDSDNIDKFVSANARFTADNYQWRQRIEQYANQTANNGNIEQVGQYAGQADFSDSMNRQSVLHQTGTISRAPPLAS